MAVAGGGCVGDHADPVLVATAGHADVEMLGPGGGVGDEDGPVDGEAFGLVDGDGVGQGDVVGGVVGGEDDPAVAVEVGDDQGAIVLAGVDVPAVSVADPEPAARDQAAVVVGGDDLVAPADDLRADSKPGSFDFASGDPFGAGAHGQGVDGGVIRRDDHDGLAGRPGVPPDREGLVDHLLPGAAADPPVGLVLAEDGVIPVAQGQAGLGLPGVDEAADLVEFRGSAVGCQQAE